MSIDRSLKITGALKRHRNVLTRTERIERLTEESRWEEGDSLMGLPKVENRLIHVKKKDAEEKPADEAGEAVVETAADTDKSGS